MVPGAELQATKGPAIQEKQSSANAARCAV
jgi:hypothetical protein